MAVLYHLTRNVSLGCAAWLPPEILSLTCDKYISFKAKHSHSHQSFNKAVLPVTACFLLFCSPNGNASVLRARSCVCAKRS